jgi:transposase
MRNGSNWIVMADSLDPGACPKCGRMPVSRHSHYIRTLRDLPAFGAAVSLKIRVGRWRCFTPECAVRVFAGRLHGVAVYRGRRTCRANGLAQWIGYALGGRPGERLIRRMGLPISNDTLLRWLKKSAKAPVTGAQVVGVDEWAKCKGRTYGTIVVDLEQNTVIDVLDRHSTEAVGNWLLAHPEIHTICRDRNGRYGKAARKGAPAAKQVADRFHLVQNLREAIERELAMHRAYLRVKLTSKEPPEATQTAPATGITEPLARVPVARERRLPPARRLATQMEIARQIRQNRQNLFDQFKTLRAAGLKISAIAQQLGLNRRRFDKWAKQSELPERNRMQPRPGSAETFREYLRQRWDAGYRNGMMLLDEIRALGYAGTYKALGKVVSPWRLGNIAFEKSTDEAPPHIAAPPPVLTDPTQRQISPQIAAALLAKPRPELTGRQAEIVDALKEGCPGYTAMRRLMMGFRSILRQPKLRPLKTKKRNARNVTALHSWMERARATGIASIQNFEYQLRRDLLAVEAAVTERWSNGPVEGQVNRLKTLKRQMYGRAGTELLRARLIPPPPESARLQRE